MNKSFHSDQEGQFSYYTLMDKELDDSYHDMSNTSLGRVLNDSNVINTPGVWSNKRNQQLHEQKTINAEAISRSFVRFELDISKVFEEILFWLHTRLTGSSIVTREKDLLHIDMHTGSKLYNHYIATILHRAKHSFNGSYQDDCLYSFFLCIEYCMWQ